jgi:hypothetical protein
MPARLSVMVLDMWATLWIVCVGAIAFCADWDRPQRRFALIPLADRADNEPRGDRSCRRAGPAADLKGARVRRQRERAHDRRKAARQPGTHRVYAGAASMM